MDANLGFARWAIPLGTWAGVRVRLNIWYPLILLLFVHWLGWTLGPLCTLILLLTTIVHEFAHIFTARLTGGEGDEILLWPLGGLAFCRTAPTFRSKFWTPAAGPLSDLILCVLTFPAVWQAGLVNEAFIPGVLPIADLTPGHFIRDLLVLTFALNWVLLLLNLIPAFPLDGGQMLKAVLALRVGDSTAAATSVRVGFFAGLIFALAGLFLDHTTIVFLGFFLVTMNLQEIFRLQVEEIYGGGYGQSEFDLYAEESEDAPRLSLWQQWKQRRQAARREREQEARIAAARRVDELLDKVHQSGMDSLTAEERHFLEQASSEYRTHPKGQS